jgi:F420-dependent oxidoreductase-like protein
MLPCVRICLMVEGQEGVTWEDWVALAETCERSGFEGLFRSDHYLSVFGRPERGALDAWATLAALGTHTRRIRLGALVSPVGFRHPAQLAKVVATVDHVSGGRVELGLGAGWYEVEHRSFGFPFPEIGERMELLEEQLEIVTRLWGEETVDFAGRHYRLEGCRNEPRPLQQPRPPILMGGRAGPKAARLAARYADEYNAGYVPFEEVVARHARVRAACEEAGRDPATMTSSVMTVCIVGRDRPELLERTRAVQGVIGRENEDPEAVLDAGSGTWIAGTVDEVVAQLRRLEELGVQRAFLQHLAHRDVGMVELIGAEVVPAVSG